MELKNRDEYTPDRLLLEEFIRSRIQLAFQELMERHGPMVYATAMRILRDPHAAEDVVQAVFLLLLKKADSLRGHPSIAGWLHRTAVFVSKAHAGKKRRRKQALASGEGLEKMETIRNRRQSTSGPEFPVELEEKIDGAMATLAEPYRHAIVLHYFEDLSIEEISRRLQVAAGTVQSRLARGLKKLRKKLRARRFEISPLALLGFLEKQHATMLQPSVVERITQAIAAGHVTPPAVAAMIEGGKLMLLKAKFQAIAVLTAVVVSGGLAVSGLAAVVVGGGMQENKPAQTPAVQGEGSAPAAEGNLQTTVGKPADATVSQLEIQEGKPGFLAKVPAEIEKKLNKHVSFEFQDTPAPEAYEFLSRLSNISIVLDPNSADAVTKSIKCSDVTLREAVKRITASSGLVAEWKNNAIYITKNPGQDVSQNKPAEGGKGELAALDANVTFSVKNSPFKEVLQMIGLMTNISVVFAQNVPEQNRNAPVTLTVRDMKASTALNWVVRMAGLDWKIAGGGIEIFNPKNETTPAGGGLKDGTKGAQEGRLQIQAPVGGKPADPTDNDSEF